MDNFIPRKSCIVCGREILKKPNCSRKSWANVKYCSRQCRDNGQLKAPRYLVCIGCGKVFERNTSDGLTKTKYCSQECYHKHSDRTTNKNYNPNRHNSEQVECACGCGTLIPKYDRKGRTHLWAMGHQALGKPRPDNVERLKELWANGTLKSRKGKEHWNWKGGITPLIRLLRHTAEYKEWRLKVYERDNWTCRNCERHCNRATITAHHVKSFEEFPDLRYKADNGITLCRKCHLKLHRETEALVCPLR